MDCALLAEVGLHAASFMKAVRELPHFQKAWNKKRLDIRDGPFVLQDGLLDSAERRFARKLGRARGILASRPLCKHDRREIALCLCRVVPGGAARTVFQFMGPAASDYL